MGASQIGKLQRSTEFGQINYILTRFDGFAFLEKCPQLHNAIDLNIHPLVGYLQLASLYEFAGKVQPRPPNSHAQRHWAGNALASKLYQFERFGECLLSATIIYSNDFA